MAIVDTYMNGVTGSRSQYYRRRRDFKEESQIRAQGEPTTQYNLLYYSGRRRDTVDYRSGYFGARYLDRKYHRRGLEKNTSRFDYGTSFYTRQDVVPIPPPPVKLTSDLGGGYQWYDGPLWPHVDCADIARNPRTSSKATLGDVGVPDVTALFSAGSHGIAETLPSVPEVSLALSLGELRERLPSMIGAQALTQGGLNSAGGEFLNYTFGIQPLIADLQAITKQAKGYDDYVDQWNRENGRLIRRGRELGSSTQTTTTNLGNGYPYPPINGAVWFQPGERSLKTQTKNKMWFVASYQVKVPPVSKGAFNKLREFTEAFGVAPTVDTAWNLFPFSWLLDWVINFDDLLTNMSYLGKKGVTLHYAYVMAETRVERTWSFYGKVRRDYLRNHPTNGVFLPYQSMWTASTITKQRRRASPLGFGVAYDGLTLSQKAILAALGISQLSF